MMMNVLWTPAAAQECYETSRWMWHPNLLCLCATPDERDVLLGAVAILRAGGWDDHQRSTAVGFLCRGEDGDVLAMQCFTRREGCIPASVRAEALLQQLSRDSSCHRCPEPCPSGIKMLRLAGVYQRNHHSKRLSPVGALARMLCT